MNIWEIVSPEFSKDENWGQPDKINGLLLLFLQRLRNRVGAPFHVNNAFRTGKTGEHPRGNAVDGYFKSLTFLEQMYRVEKAIKELQVENHIGLGIYLDWNVPGFHFDVRGERARWCRIDGKYLPIKDGIDMARANQIIKDTRYDSITF